MVRLGLSKRGRKVSHLGKIFQAKGSANAKALRWKCPGMFKEQTEV